MVDRACRVQTLNTDKRNEYSHETDIQQNTPIDT